MTLYKTIFVRRSVRQYDSMLLDEAVLSEIRNYLDSVKQVSNQPARFEIVGNEELKGGLAPYAILAYADDSDFSYVNIGYTLQGVDLYLQSIGYGSVWCGMAKPKETAADYRILLGFGKTGAPLRNGDEGFKRKKITDISNENNMVAQAARLAPSAVNLQPWKLVFADGSVTVKSNVRGIGKVLPGRLYLFDLGIVLKHVELALEHEGKTIASFAFMGKGSAAMINVSYS